MFKMRCHVCGSTHTKKNGVRKGVQLPPSNAGCTTSSVNGCNRLCPVRVLCILDVTYWGRSFGVLMALDDQTGKPLYIAFVKSETVKDYEDAVSSIKGRGYTIRGLIIDGKQSLFKTFSEYPIQMCQFRRLQACPYGCQ